MPRATCPSWSVVAAVAVAVLMASLSGGAAPVRRVLLVPPVATDATRLRDALNGQSTLATLPKDAQVQSLVFSFPAGAGRPGSLTLRLRQEARLGLWARVHPQGSLDRPGLYLSVLDEAGTFRFLVRAGDPRRVLAEWIGSSGLEGRGFRTRTGALVSRIPFLPNGEIHLFEVGAGRRVSRIHFRVRLGVDPPSTRGETTEVAGP